MRRTTMLVVCTLALALCAGSAFAGTTPPPDTLKVDYFSGANLGNPAAQLRIVNPGTFASGGICAAIYVFDSFQEMSECCSCPLSPDSLRTLDVNVDLTSNPLTGVILNTGAIKIVSTPEIGGTCPLPTRVTPTAG